MHICCANCSLYPFNRLTLKGIDIKGLWFNPNIHPEEEYSKRLEAVKTLEGLWGLDIEYIDRYGLKDFLKVIEDHEGIRCSACYRMRFQETAVTAKKMGLDGFTTTLLVSPYQRFDLIVDTGRQIEKQCNIRFYWEDMRAGWKEAVRLSRQLGLYRQKYCGCIYSKEERETQREQRPAAVPVRTR